MAKTELQKKARALLDELPRVYGIKLGTNMNADNRCMIGDEIYVNVTSFDGFYTLDRIRAYGKKNGWKPADMFPVKINAGDYGAVTNIVRVGAFENDVENFKNALFKDENDYFEKRYKKKIDEIIELAHKPFPSDDTWPNGRNKPIDEAKIVRAHEAMEERRRILYPKKGDTSLTDPDVETCIRVLKSKGYKIMAPVTEYVEV